MVSSAGRVVVIGISHREVPLPIDAFTEKEIDLLGSTVCTAADFAETVRIVGRNQDDVRRLITHRRPLGEAPEAVRYAMDHPAEVMKLVIEAAA